jgi:rhamnogalacturonan endolyase
MLAKPFYSLLALGGLVSSALADFGLTTSGTTWTVDTNAGLVFSGEQINPDFNTFDDSIHQTVNSANGDVTSLLYNGIQVWLPTHLHHVD